MSREQLAALVKRVYRESQTRSYLAGPFSPTEVRVERSAMPTRGSVEGSYPPPSEVTIRYPAPGLLPTIKGFEKAIDGLRRLAASPEINRLNHIRQLSTAFMASSLGGGHSRLEHTLGAFDIAVRLLEAANRYMVAREDAVTPFVAREVTVKAALVLAFFHDVFHAPFGHILDPLRPVLLPKRALPRIDHAALVDEFVEAKRGKGIVHELLASSVFDDPPELKDVVLRANEVLGWCFSDRMGLDKEASAFGFIADILNSSIDHDRLDYVVRDATHSFVFEDKPYNLNDILPFASFVEYGMEHRLAFDSDVGASLTGLLLLRHRLYNHVYEARSKAVYDEMLLHAVVYVLDAYGYMLPPERARVEPGQEEFGREFVRLSDHDLLRVINESRPSPKTVLARMLVQDMMANATFTVAAYGDVKNSNIPVLLERHRILKKRLDSKVQDSLSLFPLTGVEDEDGMKEALESFAVALQGPCPAEYPGQVPPDIAAATRVVGVRNVAGSLPTVSVFIDPVEGEGLYWVLSAFGLQAFYRLKLEEWFWEELKRWEGFDHWASELTEKVVEFDPRIAECLPENQDEVHAWVRQEIEATPLVFVSLSRLEAKDFSGAWLKDVGKERKALLVKEEPDGEAIVMALDVRPQDSPNNYWIGVFRPRSLPAEADRILERALEELLRDGNWIHHYIRSVRGA